MSFAAARVFWFTSLHDSTISPTRLATSCAACKYQGQDIRLLHANAITKQSCMQSKGSKATLRGFSTTGHSEPGSRGYRNMQQLS